MGKPINLQTKPTNEMKRHTLVLFILAALLTSCSSHRYCASSFKSAVPESIPLVQPYVDIFAIGKGQAAYSDSLSQVATQVLTGILDDNLSQFPISEFIQIDDDEYDRLIGRAGDELADKGRHTNARRVRNFPLPESIRQLMVENDFPYLMFLYESGFHRPLGDVVKEAATDVALGVGLSILTAVLTGVVVTPVVSGNYSTEGTNLTLFVADRDANVVVYYNYVESESDPLDRSDVFPLVWRLFKDYPRR